jgi:hypothetical protein
VVANEVGSVRLSPAEGEGLEPSVDRKAHNGFRDESRAGPDLAVQSGIRAVRREVCCTTCCIGPRKAARRTAVRGQLHLGAGTTVVRGFRVTARDKQIVRWISRLRMATAAQVAARFRLGRAVTYTRLGGLLQLGLLEHVRIFHSEPGVYCATRLGLSVAGLELPPARIDIRSYAHDVDLSALVIDLEREFGPEQVTTEREMRAMDTSLASDDDRSQLFGVELAGAHGQLQLTPAGRPRLHFPDCAAVDASDASMDTLLAVELERTAKGRARLRRILPGYIAARHIGAVRYYAVGERVRRLVEGEVAAQRAQALIDVRIWSPTGKDRMPLRKLPKPIKECRSRASGSEATLGNRARSSSS